VGRRLITYKAFAERLGRSTKTLDRLYGRRTPKLPPIVRLGRDRVVDEALVDRFIDVVTTTGGFPKQAPFQPTGAAAMRVQEAKAYRHASQPPRRKKWVQRRTPDES
jgi:predicted DNA-binding transcriptional regulator AlpA